MPKKNTQRTPRRKPSSGSSAESDLTGRRVRTGQLRIIGGRLRGSAIQYTGDPRTRPMKDRVREAVFNLVGPSIQGTHAIDLFAGTGALALESLSRGSVRATAIERHFPSARVIEDNARQLKLTDSLQVLTGDTFFWAKKLPNLGTEPWVVYCCPPYALYQDDHERMLKLIDGFVSAAPPGSRIVVESDENFDFRDLVQADRWDVRPYPPAFVGILRITD